MNDPRQRLRAVIEAWREPQRATMATAVVLVVALLASVSFALVPLGSGPTYTEFYVLGPDDAAGNYPSNLSVGESATLQVGIESSENSPRSYTMVVQADGSTIASRELTLSPGERHIEAVSLSFQSPGSKQVELDLYEDPQTGGEPYRHLQLFVQVRDG